MAGTLVISSELDRVRRGSQAINRLSSLRVSIDSQTVLHHLADLTEYRRWIGPLALLSRLPWASLKASSNLLRCIFPAPLHARITDAHPRRPAIRLECTISWTSSYTLECHAYAFHLNCLHIRHPSFSSMANFTTSQLEGPRDTTQRHPAHHLAAENPGSSRSNRPGMISARDEPFRRGGGGGMTEL
ncbi:hypothetical protein BKA70DRAFT_122757 [Coprinopsis sp. MPI-PUGE-AT-0042]|nr:hypothetical protein BKA70DRAFT_122757 [Coprinopsis sp. MPI-PUGE-AT-0042]